MFEVVLSPEAQDFYAAADKPLARKLARCFRQLEREPRRHSAIRMLTGPFAGMRRYRIGDWRAIFTIDEERSLVSVLAIAHRREVYE
ncbi:type II toxin-antitoxin system RelE/ParE family toxin [bacterium]|nr:type II toxin-antitoxin system RelE/ParE family toxin [bacterium]